MLEMKLVWIFAFLPLCLGVHEVSNETCMIVEIMSQFHINFTSLVNGSTLNVCSQYLQDELQCCSQSDEDALGFRFANDITLGIEDFPSLLNQYEDLLIALFGLQTSLLNDVLQPLMNYSVVREVGYSFDDLDMIRDEVLRNISGAFVGAIDANLTEEIIRYFTEGISGFYVNLTFTQGNSLTASEMACATDAIYEYLFPPVEQAKIASLGDNLQQIAVASEVARTTAMSIYNVFMEVNSFEPTPTCTNVWTEQYACPLCAGQDISLCQGRCNEVVIGCTSSLQQVMVQLNVLLDFVRASVRSLLSGDPYDDININNIDDIYTSAFETSLSRTGNLVDVVNDPNGADCGISVLKRSVDYYYLVRNKRQSTVMFPNVTVDQSLVTEVNNVLPAVRNVSLDGDYLEFCDFVRADGPSTNCTIGVDNVSPYNSTFDRREITDQEDNPAGTFNLTQLREQARLQTYVVTELLTNRSDIMRLYENVLPGRDIPNLDFFNEPTPSPTSSMSVNPTVSDMLRPTQTGGDGDPTITMSVNPTVSDMLRPTQTSGATSIAVSFSLFITLAASLFTSVFVN